MFLSSVAMVVRAKDTALTFATYAQKAGYSAARATKQTVRTAADYLYANRDSVHHLKKEIQASLKDSQFGAALQGLDMPQRFELMILLLDKDNNSEDPTKRSTALEKIESFLKQHRLGGFDSESQEQKEDFVSIDTASHYSTATYACALTAFQFENVARMQGTVICATAEAVIRFLFLPDDPHFAFSFYDILSTLSKSEEAKQNISCFSNLPIFYDFLKQQYSLKDNLSLLEALYRNRIVWAPFFPLEDTPLPSFVQMMNLSASPSSHLTIGQNSDEKVSLD